MTDKPSKAQLLAELDREWAGIERTCFKMSEEQMLARGAKGEWSVKDTLAHLSAWEKYLLDRLGYVMTGQLPLYPVMTSMADVDNFNARVYEENKDRPLTSVVIEFRNLYSGVMTVLNAIDEGLLDQPYSYDWPGDSLNLLQLIRVNTCDHFHEHCETIGSENHP
jgi:hypothetical protein